MINIIHQPMKNMNITNFKNIHKLSNNDFNNFYKKFSNLNLNNRKSIDLKSNKNLIKKDININIFKNSIKSPKKPKHSNDSESPHERKSSKSLKKNL